MRRTAGRALGRTVCAVAAVLLTAPGAAAAQDTLPPPADTANLPPAGYGTLRQEDIAVRLETPAVLLRVLPLHEAILRLLSPDSYASLHRLQASREAQIAAAANRNAVRRPSVFLVTFFGLQERAPFSPDDVTITSRNRFFRPVAILPITAAWSAQQLEQRETASAIYVYEDGIPFLEPFTLSYGGASTEQWGGTLRTLDQERARVLARAAADRRQVP